MRRQTREEMTHHLSNHGFTRDYTRWTYHGEANRMRDEVVRQRIEDHDADAGGYQGFTTGCHLAHFEGEHSEEEPEPTAKAYYDMLAAAQEPLHGHTKVSHLDAIARLMAVKSQFTLSRDVFDVMLQVIGSLLSEGHILSKKHV